MLRKLWREPLVHFLVLGTLLFLIADVRGGGGSSVSRVVEVTPERVEQIRRVFERSWQRPPSQDELRELVDEHVREEIYYREARELGLDRDDPVIRERLRQKLEFLTDEMGAVPTDDELRAYLRANAEEFRLPPRLRVRQVFFSVDRRGDGAVAAASELLSELPAGEWPEEGEELGDPLLASLPEGWTDTDELGRLFGRVFAEKVMALPTGEWSGPVRSGYGLHLILITDREEGREPTFEEVRPAVERAWVAERRAEAADTFYAELRSRYEVEIPPLEEPTTSGQRGESR